MLSEALATGGTVLIALGACIAVGGAVVLAVGLFDRWHMRRSWRAADRKAREMMRREYPRRW